MDFYVFLIGFSIKHKIKGELLKGKREILSKPLAQLCFEWIWMNTKKKHKNLSTKQLKTTQ